MRPAALLLAPLLAWAPRASADGLPRDREKALREHLAKLVAEPDPAARRALAEAGAALVGDAPVADVVAAVRKGPVYPAGLPKPRKVAGKTEAFTTAGSVVVGYSFQHGARVWRYAVDVPKGYDPEKPAGLLLDPGHGTGRGKPDAEKAGFLDMWRRFCDAAGHRDWLVARTEIVEQAGVDGERPLPDDDGILAFDAFFRDLFSRFHVDPDRVYVTGLSQTGFWAWQLGVARADRFAGIAPMSAVTGDADRYAGNLLALPVHVLHGDADTTCPVEAPRRTHALLRRIGADAEYREVAGAGHEYAVWEKLPEGLKRLGQTPRARYPRRISKSVRNASGPWCSWVRVDAIAKEGKREAGEPPTAGVDAEVDGQTVRVFSDGVTALTVCLSADLVDLGKPVTVVWNGKTVHEGVVAPSVAGLLERVGEKCDWTATLEAAVPLGR